MAAQLDRWRVEEAACWLVRLPGRGDCGRRVRPLAGFGCRWRAVERWQGGAAPGGRGQRLSRLRGGGRPAQLLSDSLATGGRGGCPLAGAVIGARGPRLAGGRPLAVLRGSRQAGAAAGARGPSLAGWSGCLVRGGGSVLPITATARRGRRSKAASWSWRPPVGAIVGVGGGYWGGGERLAMLAGEEITAWFLVL